MNSCLKKCLLWYYLITKRLLKKVSFIAILALIPLCTLLMMNVKDDEKGLLRVALASEAPQEALSKEMMDALDSESKIVGYTVFQTSESAIDAVRCGDADVAWVLEDNLSQKIKQNVAGKKIPIVNVYAAEDNILIKASRELMFSKVYSRVAYDVFKGYVERLNLPSEKVTEEILQEAFYVVGSEESLLEFEFKGTVQMDFDESSYLTSPLRGLLATIMLLCAMASTMYFLNDEKNNTFSSFSLKKRWLIFFAGNLSAALLSAVFVLIALAISGLIYNVILEIVSIIIFAIMCSAFSMCLGAISRKPERFSILIPIVFVVTIVFTPVIFTIDIFEPLQVLFPTYLYLFVSKNLIYLGFMALYAVVALVVAISLYVLQSRRFIVGKR